MKKIMLLCLFFAAFTSVYAGDRGTVKIEGTIKNLSEYSKFGLLHIVHQVMNYNKSVPVQPDVKTGKFTAELQLSGAHKIMLYIDRNRTEFFAEPGKTIRFEVDAEDMMNSLTFSGDMAEINNTAHAYKKELGGLRNKVYSLIRESEGEEFLKKMEELSAKIETFTKEREGFEKLPDTYKDFFTAERIGLLNTALTQYKSYHKYFNKTEEEPEVPANFYDKLSQSPVFKESFILSGNFTSYLDALINFQIARVEETVPMKKENEFNNKRFDMAGFLYGGIFEEYMKAAILKSAFDYSSFDTANALFKRFSSEFSETPYFEPIEEAYGAAEKLKKGNPAPAFTVKTPDGKDVALSDFKGKVVFLDFWASWCAPCRAEMPHAKKIKDAFKDKDVVFLYVSVDEDTEAWKKAMKDMEIKGVHGISPGFESYAPQEYNVSGIPAYFIIDKEGKFFESRPGRPSSGDVLIGQLNEALNAD